MTIPIKENNVLNILAVHNYIMVFLIFVLILVVLFILLITIIYNYANPSKINSITNLPMIIKGLKFTHNITLEIIWTVVPIIIIIEIIFPSLALIADDEIDLKKGFTTLNIIGNQWFWEYELNDSFFSKNISSNLIDNKFRSLVTNNFLKLPVGEKICLFITSNDVGHSWALPTLGIKVDAIPSRINFKNFQSNNLTTHVGMCSELCGVEHGFMPINVQIVPKSNYLLDNTNTINWFNNINLNVIN